MLADITVNIEIVVADSGPRVLLEVLPALYGAFVEPLPGAVELLVARGRVFGHERNRGKGQTDPDAEEVVARMAPQGDLMVEPGVNELEILPREVDLTARLLRLVHVIDPLAAQHVLENWPYDGVVDKVFKGDCLVGHPLAGQGLEESLNVGPGFFKRDIEFHRDSPRAVLAQSSLIVIRLSKAATTRETNK
jgi:hypothetical protein